MSTSLRQSPRDRLLSVAGQIFYREGIHRVGVEKVLSAARVTRATMYRHFNGKDDLVLAYLEAEDLAIRQLLSDAAGQAEDPGRLIDVVVARIAEDIERHHTRGCPFINAATEYSDPESLVRRLVSEHRRWFCAELTQLARAAGHPAPDDAARSLVLLRDAAMVGGYLDGAETAVAAFRRTAEAVLAGRLELQVQRIS